MQILESWQIGRLLSAIGRCDAEERATKKVKAYVVLWLDQYGTFCFFAGRDNGKVSFDTLSEARQFVMLGL